MSEDGERTQHGYSPEGDSVCWIDQVCTECGALVEAELPAICWRCGTQLAPS